LTTGLHNHDHKEMPERILSSEGHIVIPQKLREAKGWKPGQAFALVDEGEALRLEPMPSFPGTSVEEVAGCLAYDGPAIPVEQLHGGSALRDGMRSSARGT